MRPRCSEAQRTKAFARTAELPDASLMMRSVWYVHAQTHMYASPLTERQLRPDCAPLRALVKLQYLGHRTASINVIVCTAAARTTRTTQIKVRLSVSLGLMAYYIQARRYINASDSTSCSSLSTVHFTSSFSTSMNPSAGQHHSEKGLEAGIGSPALAPPPSPASGPRGFRYTVFMPKLDGSTMGRPRNVRRRRRFWHYFACGFLILFALHLLLSQPGFRRHSVSCSLISALAGFIMIDVLTAAPSGF